MNHINPTDLFGFIIQDLARLMSRVFEKEPGDLKISRGQARLLAYIAITEGASQSHIATLMDVQKISLSKMVDELELRGLIERHPDPLDRRVKRLFMANGAKSIIEDVWNKLSKVSDIALSALPESQREGFLSDLMTVRNNLINHLNDSQAGDELENSIS